MTMLKTVIKTEYDRDRTLLRPFFVPCHGTETALIPGAVSSFSGQNLKKEVFSILKEQNSPLQSRRRSYSVGRCLHTGFMSLSLAGALSTYAFAADTIWTKASAIMQDVYSQIVAISTIAAVVCASVALLLMNFSRSDRTVQESRSWLKRIILSWAILNGLGFIMAYITPFFAGGTYTP